MDKKRVVLTENQRQQINFIEHFGTSLSILHYELIIS
jgi:hypothetical protein